MPDALKSLTELVPAVDLSRRERIALLVVDMQYHDASPDHGLTRAMEITWPGSMAYYSQRLESTTVPAIRRLLEFFRAERMAVVHLVLGSHYRDLRECPERFRAWTRNLERATGAEDLWWSGSAHYRILEEVEPLPEETIIRKTANGAFNGSGIDAFLQRTGISTLVITGVVTSACIETTARDAADRGYDCLLVDEATADYDADMHRATLRVFALNFGGVADTAEEVMAAVRDGTSLSSKE